MLIGWKTILVNAALMGAGPVLEYLGTVNWLDLVGPTGSVIVMGVINIAMRFVTKTPVFNK